MSTALTFSLKQPLQQAVNCAALVPSNLANKSLAEIAALSLPCGNSSVRADSIFDISGDNSQHIVFKNSTSKLDYLGAYLAGGQITIEGDAGAYLGIGMRSGEIHCLGNTTDFAACNMAGGSLTIHGNAGDFLGAATSGLRKGMRGGVVIVKGSTGDRVGDQMRRGLILIEGNTGDYCGSRMIAGTIGVLGSLGRYAGYNMQRGTLLITQSANLHVSMVDCGTHSLPFLNLLMQSLKQYGTGFSNINSRRVQRYVGDVACGGNGEILQFQL